MKTLISKVEGYEGECRPTWLNKNGFLRHQDQGISGFFRLVHRRFFGIPIRHGDEFHGIIKNGEGFITSTEDMD